MQRRMFLRAVGVGAASTAVSWSVGSRALENGSRAAHGADRVLLAPIEAGLALPHGWRVVEVRGIEAGAIPIRLAHEDGTAALVGAFRRGPRSRGIAQTALLDLRVMNDAHGHRPTNEGLGLAVMTLAARIRRAERAMMRRGATAEQRAALSALRTHEQRLANLGCLAPREVLDRQETA